MRRSSALAGICLLLAMGSGARAVPCADERDNADDMVEFCKEVSPATHPPCNAQNECAVIEAEISRGCRMLPAEERPAQCKGF